MRGFAALPLIIAVFIAGIVGIGWFTLSHQSQTSLEADQVSPSPILSPSPSPTPTGSPSPSPTKAATSKPSSGTLIDCIGPDGKHTQLAKTACDAFQKAWATPTPSPKPSTQTSSSVTGCGAYNLGGDLGTLTVNIQAGSGSLSGDAGVTISRKYPECTGVDPGWPFTQVIHQGSTSTSFGGMRPGPFHIEVSYHGNNTGQDVNINSGGNSTTVTVSN